MAENKIEVLINNDNNRIVYYSNMGWEVIPVLQPEIIEWLKTEVSEYSWIDSSHCLHGKVMCDIYFYFSNISDAMYFKLVWS
jgi:hypothetical protein